MFNVIAVDDESDVKVLFDHFFKEEVDDNDIKLFFRDNAESCLELLKELNGKTIVISDINMPGMNGIDLVKRINEDYPDTKIILVSAYDRSYYASRIKESRISSFIGKPVDFAMLKDLVFEYAGEVPSAN